MRVLTSRDHAGGTRPPERLERHGGRGRRGRYPEPVRLSVLRQNSSAVAHWPLPPVRCRSRRYCDQRGVRGGGPQAPHHRRVLPPTLVVTKPNPRVDFPATPFYVNSEPRPWVHPGDDPPRRAAVSAFGFGGTNFHVVLEEYTGGFLPDADASLESWPAE